MINFYQYKVEIKISILKRKERLDAHAHPNEAAWLAYALLADGRENNELLKGMVKELLRWALSEGSDIHDRNLCPLSLCCLLADSEEQRQSIRERIIGKLGLLLAKDLDRFSILNDPVQVFSISLATAPLLATSLKKQLADLCKKNLSETKIIRQVFFTASLVELGEKPSSIPKSDDDIADPVDLISILWFFEHFARAFPHDVSALWERFEKVKEGITFEGPSGEEHALRPLSNFELALLYESVSAQARRVDPVSLFDNYPLHPRVREIAEKHFKTKSFVQAVEQATRAFNEYIQQKSGVTNKSETALVQSTMKQVDRPKDLKIKFNDALDQESGKNEQAGLALIAEGIFKAYRNPKGHKPEDHPLVQIDPYQALDQLITISYLMKRVDDAK
jgi:uncharacterized protein (TIGR02391 family)